MTTPLASPSSTDKTRDRSQEAFDALKSTLAGGVSSPVRSGSSVKQTPMIADHAEGDTVVDVDGYSYIDYVCSWGALILGHANRTVLKAAMDRAARGTSFGISCEVEATLGNEIKKLVPSIDKLRFVSSGTEATMTAARLARGYTGRDVIVKFAGCYHGHADLFLVQAGSGVMGLTPTSTSAGIPADVVRDTVCLRYNDLEQCKEYLLDPANRDRVAAVIVEPIAGNMGVVPGHLDFLEGLRSLTSEIGALLIFDEVISGFRAGLGGAQGRHGITPDLTCLGKIVGGGFPAAALGGRAEVMDALAPLGAVYQAGTLSGNPVAMEAGLQTLKLLQEEGVYEALEQKANIITKPVSEFIERVGMNACVQQDGSLFTIFFGKEGVRNMDDAGGLDTDRYARFFQYCFRSGIHPPPSQYEAWFVSLAHTEEHLEKTRDVIIDCLDRFHTADC